MSATRLLVLGLLNSRGPMHGYQIRRRAQAMNVEAWGDVPLGSLYHALQRMETEALVEVVRRERAGRFPARTVYAVTSRGREELAALLGRALSEVALPPDPFDVALTAGLGADLGPLPAALAAREAFLESFLAELRQRRQGLVAAGVVGPRALAVFRHWEIRVEAELRFRAELEATLPELGREAAAWGGAPPVAPPTARPVPGSGPARGRQLPAS